jgi:hypothetical protein
MLYLASMLYRLCYGEVWKTATGVSRSQQIAILQVTLSMSLSANRLDCMLDAGNKQSNEREDLGMHGWQGRAD